MKLERNWSEEEKEILKNNYGVITAQEIYNRNLLPGRTLTAIRSRAKYIKLKSDLRELDHTFDIDFWKVPNVINAYWAGEIASDGAMMKLKNKNKTYVLQLQVSVKDKDHLLKFKRALKHSGEIKSWFSTCPISTRDPNEKHEQCYLRICQGWKFEKDLRENWGIIPQKTYRVAPPAAAINNILKLSYLAGYIDGDGSVTADYSKMRPNISISSCSYKILDWFQEVVDSMFPETLKGKASALPHFREIEEKCCLYSICGFRAAKMIDIIPRLPIPVMDRKWRAPRILEIVEFYKQKYPDVWTIRLPIEDEIDAFLSTYKPLTSQPEIPEIQQIPKINI